ncbi:MAG TPA: CGNR zinc finger domain-containing protein [Sporichthyaceae bacterium]|jgi:predicted RNA-binding Zn ribbon-like protein
MRTLRPLAGEPLAMDLLNTVWMAQGEPVDVLVDLADVQAWLDLEGIDARATAPVQAALLRARSVIRAHAEAPESASARAALNEVLRWGFRRPVLTEGGVGHEQLVEDPTRWAGWLAASNYVDLLARGSDRIRQCAHEACVLWFYDDSTRGGRRWCSMAGCGNRAKAARHYARTRVD